MANSNFLIATTTDGMKTIKLIKVNIISTWIDRSCKHNVNEESINALLKDAKTSGKMQIYPNGTIDAFSDTPLYTNGQLSVMHLELNNKFICKIYKKKKNGEEIRLRNKLKKTLKLAHNYVREFLNQKLKKKKSSKSKADELDKIIRGEEPQIQQQPMDFNPPMMATPPPRKTIIRRFE